MEFNYESMSNGSELQLAKRPVAKELVELSEQLRLVTPIWLGFRSPQGLNQTLHERVLPVKRENLGCIPYDYVTILLYPFSVSI